MSLAMLLGPTASAANLFATLKQAYGDKDGRLTAGRFAAAGKLFDAVDANGNGEWTQDEVLGLNRAEPQLRLKISLGEKGQGLVIESHAAEVEKPEVGAVNAGGVTSSVVGLPGVKVTLAANTAVARAQDYTSYAQSYVNNYDKDKNGYIEKDEMPGNLAPTFTSWDTNDDGKVYLDEIKTTFERQQAPMMSQVRATVTAQGNALFTALDANRDGRLGLREMRTAPQRLGELDKNKDGQVTPDEVPISMTLAFGLGNAGYYAYAPRVVQPGSGGTAAGTPAAGPEWFTRMDRNGDGDVTEREFLGTPEQFKKLDANGDGFIERSEAEAAKK
jgi:Ca2+-binding EF-hand superfamily protein